METTHSSAASFASSTEAPKHLPPIQEDLLVGVDVGGTKVHIANSLTTTIRRYETSNYANLDAILEDYFQSIQARPIRIVIGMAGPRDEDTGEIKLTNFPWPSFNPHVAADRYGISFATANDMVISMAGILQETGVDLLPLKSGTPTRTGAKLVVALSTGIGTATAVWDTHTKRYVIATGEGGHIGFQPKNEHEHHYVTRLHKKYPHASIELAISGKYGIDNLLDHMLESAKTPHLAAAIERTRKADRPVGPVLLEYATVGNGLDQEAAQSILKAMGDMLGSALRDLAVTCKATGGIYLAGSVALGLGEYFAEYTDFQGRFVRKGAVHDDWLKKVPIYLVTDSNVAVKGALAMARGVQP